MTPGQVSGGKAAGADSVLLAAGRRSLGQSIVLGILVPFGFMLAVAAFNLNLGVVWALFALYLIAVAGVATWTGRILLRRGVGTLYEESGWPALGVVASGSPIGETGRYERVLWRTVEEEGKSWRELVLDGKEPLALCDNRGGRFTPTRAKAAAVALVVGLPLIEQPGPYGREERPPASELALLVQSTLGGEEQAGKALQSCFAILVGNGVTLLGVLFAHWDPGTVYALFWLDLCAIVLFTLLRVASGDFGREIGRGTQAMLAVLLGVAAIFPLGFAGETLRLALDLPAPPGAGVSVLSTFSFALHAIRQGGAWVALLALLAGHTIAYALDWNRGETAQGAKIGRLVAVGFMRLVFTAAVGGLAALFLLRVPGAGSSAVLAVLIAGRAGFEVWGHLAIHAPLWLVGDLDVMRAAKAAEAARPAR